MFTSNQQRAILDAVDLILRMTNDPALPATGPISFRLFVKGADGMTYADLCSLSDRDKQLLGRDPR